MITPQLKTATALGGGFRKERVSRLLEDSLELLQRRVRLQPFAEPCCTCIADVVACKAAGGAANVFSHDDVTFENRYRPRGAGFETSASRGCGGTHSSFCSVLFFSSILPSAAAPASPMPQSKRLQEGGKREWWRHS